MASFDEIFDRIKLATNTRTQVELAEVLDIRQSSISDAKRRNSIPSDWYMKLFEKFGLNPDWLKKGLGPMYLRTENGYEPVDGPNPGILFEAGRYGEPEASGVLVTVYSMSCDGSDEEGWKLRPESKLNIPQNFASPSVEVVRMDAASMEPVVRRGAYVGLDTAQRNVVSGELYGVYVPFEGLALKRIFLDAENSRFILRSENRSHPDQYVSVDKIGSRIHGRTVWVLQEI